MNPWAGEVPIRVDGRVWPARLTLGALAELEEELGAASLVELVERFESGRFSSRDVMAVLRAGLRGAGWGGGPAEFLAADLGMGPIEAAQAAARLFARAFGLARS